MVKKKINIIKWTIIALVAVLLAAPNGTILKVVSDQMDPLWLNAMRFGIIALVLLPYTLRKIKTINKRALWYTVGFGLAFTMSVIGYVYAIKLTQASFVSTIDLGIPILIMLYSVYLTKERVSKQSFIGIGLAALGAFVMIALPALAGGGLESGFHFGATLLALMNCATFPLTLIFSRKANEAGMTLTSVFGIGAIIVSLLTLTLALVLRMPLPPAEVFSHGAIFGIIYSALLVSLLSRLLTVAAYERLGSATVAGFHYLESFLAILLPILILHEKITLEMVVGGALILGGVILIEHRAAPHLHAHRKRIPRHT